MNAWQEKPDGRRLNGELRPVPETLLATMRQRMGTDEVRDEPIGAWCRGEWLRMGQERWMRPEPLFLSGGVGFYRGLFAMALLVCGFFMFRETPLPQGFAQSDKVAPVGSFLVDFADLDRELVRG